MHRPFLCTITNFPTADGPAFALPVDAGDPPDLAALAREYADVPADPREYADLARECGEYADVPADPPPGLPRDRGPALTCASRRVRTRRRACGRRRVRSPGSGLACRRVRTRCTHPMPRERVDVPDMQGDGYARDAALAAEEALVAASLSESEPD